MSDEKTIRQPLDFEEYIRAGEPQKRERAYAWRTAIGLQAVDGLTVSDYLKETARRNIEGEITIDEAKKLIKTYYQSKTKREPDDDEKQEADQVSVNITEILNSPSFTFSITGLSGIHRQIFEGTFKFAGQFRQYDITKKEWVLRGDTVLYAPWQDIREALQYDLEQERQFLYDNLTMEQVAEHIAKFVSGIWQIHPFAEGNTRTTAVFTVKYLRSLGFQIGNELFSEHSWYFRNALVRANYQNVQKGITYDYTYINRFFGNLLLGEEHVLRNRYLIIEPNEELKREWEEILADEQTRKTTPAPTPATPPATTPATSPASPRNMFWTDNEKILNLIKSIGNHQLSIKEMLAAVGLKDRMNFIDYTLNPAIKEGFVKQLYPDNPHHPRQKYLLTVKGVALLNELENTINTN